MARVRNILMSFWCLLVILMSFWVVFFQRFSIFEAFLWKIHPVTTGKIRCWKFHPAGGAGCGMQLRCFGKIPPERRGSFGEKIIDWKKCPFEVGTTPLPVTVTTRIVTFLIGNPYKPSFVTVTVSGVDLRDMLVPRRRRVSVWYYHDVFLWSFFKKFLYGNFAFGGMIVSCIYNYVHTHTHIPFRMLRLSFFSDQNEGFTDFLGLFFAHENNHQTKWWLQIFVGMFTPKIGGKMTPIWRTRWRKTNHQPATSKASSLSWWLHWVHDVWRVLMWISPWYPKPWSALDMWRLRNPKFQWKGWSYTPEI